ncbi:uncharacterized protein LOC134277302 [Saccostrea cucullata]|uniref:uncharacterized protein LOC134277302 n=1 Tax=Saccostrea cuccullata TaxID=36930 RepID=UPI002ED281E2
MSIFYARMCVYDKCSTSSYVDLDEKNETKGQLQLSMIDVQIESLLAIVLGGVGWLILFWNTKRKVSIPSMFVIGGILLLVAVTSEFAVLLRFIATNASRKASQGKDSALGFPYSLILVGFGIVFMLVAVIRSFVFFIRNEHNEDNTKTYQQTEDEPGRNITENKI